MTIFKRELKKNMKSFLVWTIVMVGFNVMIMAFFPSIAGEADTFNELMDMYPDSMKSIFGLDKLDMTTVIGFYGTEMYLFVTLLGSIFATLLGSAVISKEESEKTIEFLLSKPVTRNRIVTEKTLCVLVYLLLFNAIIVASNFILFEIFKEADYSMKVFVLLSAGPLLLHLTFAATGLFVSMFIVKTKAVYPVSIGLVMSMYFLSIVSSLSEKTRNLKYLTPFKYIDAADLVVNERIRPVFIVIMVCIMIASVLGTYFVYKRKEIII